jgi:hypothetical protein
LSQAARRNLVRIMSPTMRMPPDQTFNATLSN